MTCWPSMTLCDTAHTDDRQAVSAARVGASGGRISAKKTPEAKMGSQRVGTGSSPR
jgi:hypothetical protein